MPYDPTTPRGQVRLLLNDVNDDDQIFTDAEVDALLLIEGGSVKLAAAQAIDTNATNLALASRVLRTQDLSTDGAKLADAMRKHAASLREQVAESDDEGAFFEIVPLDSTAGRTDYFFG